MRSTRSDLGALVAGATVVFFSLLLLWHNPLVFWNDDYQLSILPVFADVARSWNEGHWPLLSPYSWVCNNLAGEFQYGTFSIFVNTAVILIWKFPLKFPQQAATLSITHLFVLAVGAFLLARDRKLSNSLSIFVALVASLNGWIICWGASDWFGALGAFAWLPWCWWALERALDPQRSRWRFLRPAPFVYLLVTGGFPYTILMLALLIGWISIRSFSQTRRFASILPMWFGIALGFGMSAPAWLVVFNYVQGSAREIQSASVHWQWIVPWRALPGFILPNWTVNWTDFSTRHLPHTGIELTCGLVAPSAIVAGLLWPKRRFVRQMRWELILLALALLLSMLPMFGLFRWSFRWLPFVHLVLAICAAETLRILPRRAASTTAFVLVGTIAIAIALFHFAGTNSVSLTWIFPGLALFWLVAELVLPNESWRSWLPPSITCATLLATYFCIPTNYGVPKFNLSQELTKSAPLDPQRLYLSIYPMPEIDYRIEKKPDPIGQLVRPGSTSMWAGLRFVNGYSPVRPAGVARQFNFAIHGEIDPSTAAALLYDRSDLLGNLGIDGIVVAREMSMSPPPDDWSLALANDEAQVFYRNGPPLARVRSINRIDPMSERKFASAKISGIVDERNSVRAEVAVENGDEPALLIFSRPYFDGYRAQLSGRQLPVTSYRGLCPLVEIPRGASGQFVLTYRPLWLIIGAALALCSAAIFFVGLVAAAKFQYTSRL